MARLITVAALDHGRRHLGAVVRWAFAAAVLLVSAGCHRGETPAAVEKLDQATSRFDIYWPPRDPEEARAKSMPPLLNGTLAVDAKEQTQGGTEVRLAVTLTRPSAEADRRFWNSALAFADIDWMDEVRVWDSEKKWLWPNLPYLLRLPGKERIERYGGLDPGKNVDNDFAAVLIRKYDADGLVESADTKDAPLVSAEWHAVGAAHTDLNSIVHAAKSDEFVLHLGADDRPARGQLKVWLVYADFLGARPPRTWPKEREWAGGILAHFEIDWETAPGRGCYGVVRPKRPAESTRFDWAKWVVRTPGSDESKAQFRLSDRSEKGP
jgi:hypothetical protein